MFHTQLTEYKPEGYLDIISGKSTGLTIRQPFFCNRQKQLSSSHPQNQVI